MKTRLPSFILILTAFVALGFYAVHAQQGTAAHANDFSSASYYDAPHQTVMKSRLAGAEAQPLAGGLLAIKQLKLERFETNGALQVVIQAPDCVYDTGKGTATSPGHLRVETADGKSRVEGDGFLWRQKNGFLTISNHVQTVIAITAEQKIGL